MPFPPKEDPTKLCVNCGQQFYRRRFGTRLEDRSRFLTRANCSQTCGNSKAEVVKSTNHWRARQHMAKACAECGTTHGLHVHHIDRTPANNHPSNLMTLCASHHLKLHWREDREKRVAAMRSRGGRTN